MSRDNLDKYRVLAKLGRGGMADVYLATASGPAGFSKLLVLKVLQQSLSESSQFLAMFLDEARLAARLNHPNVVQTYEVGESEGRHFIAMEYLEGQALSRLVQTVAFRGDLPLGASLRIGVDALAGLHYAHELRDFEDRPLGVVHRDITPQNVFVTYEGQVKLVDFGIAKAQDSRTETQVGTVKGKVAYMAPEQARGESVTRTADLFSMGVVLWELVSGKRLWEGLTDIAVIGRLVQGDIPDLRALRPDLPPGIADLIRTALDPDPARRPQTALEFQQGLELELEKLSYRFNARALGELMQREFRAEREHVRAVLRKQFERVIRDTPTGVSSPAGRRIEGVTAGDMPILGAGSSVHDAPTTIHTGLTPPELSALAREARTAAPEVKSRRSFQGALWAALFVGGTLATAATLSASKGAFSDTETEPGADKAQGEVRDLAAKPQTVGVSTPISSSVPSACGSGERPLVELTGEISSDATLRCNQDYLLRFTTVVPSGVTLTVEPGTRILGDFETKGTLVVQPGGRIFARGTRDQPIVFTSAETHRPPKAGDWGGVILLGQAPLNLKNNRGAPMRGKVEGLTQGGEYGGKNENDSSGVLSYVRIEYSGIELAPNNEINGLTLAGVGRGTVLDHIQVRHTADDCFEFFGGTVDAKYLICQSAGDDSFDWDYGYTGRLQFLVSQADPRVSAGSNGFEGDNDPAGTQNQPLSSPTIYNTTFCGKHRALDGKEHFGILLRRGSQLRLRNGLFIGFDSGLDLRDPGTKLNIAASIFFENGEHNLAYPEARGDSLAKHLKDDDGGFDELAHLKNPGLRISESNPRLGNCYDLASPGFKPDVPLEQFAALPPRDGFFSEGVNYVGAFRDRNDAWDEGGWAVWGD